MIGCGTSRTVSALTSESLLEHLLLLSPEQSAKLEEGRKQGLPSSPLSVFLLIRMRSTTTSDGRSQPEQATHSLLPTAAFPAIGKD